MPRGTLDSPTICLKPYQNVTMREYAFRVDLLSILNVVFPALKFAWEIIQNERYKESSNSPPRSNLFFIPSSSPDLKASRKKLSLSFNLYLSNQYFPSFQLPTFVLLSFGKTQQQKTKQPKCASLSSLLLPSSALSPSPLLLRLLRNASPA